MRCCINRPNTWMHPTIIITAEKLLRHGGRPRMGLQWPHLGTIRLVQRPSTTSRHLGRIPERRRLTLLPYGRFLSQAFNLPVFTFTLASRESMLD